MPEDTKKDKKEKTLSLKTNTKSSKSTIGARSRGGSRVSTVVVESKRGKISKTRKPSAPNIKTRTSSVTSRKIKEPTDNDISGNLTDKERVAREKALLDADERKKNKASLEKEISKKKAKKKRLKKKKFLLIYLQMVNLKKVQRKKVFLLKKLRLKVHRQEKRKVKVKIKIKQQKNPKMNLKKGEKES